MSSDYSARDGQLHTAEIFRDKWLWLVLLGGVLIAAGVIAILVPAVSDVAASKVLGSVLIVSGILQVMQWFLKLPSGHSFTPATVAGISLMFAGWAYLAMALAARKAS